MTTSHLQPLRALTIAGFDPSGGAGVLADARTFAAFGFDPLAAITSITFQSTNKVFGAVHQSAETVRSQLSPLLAGPEITCAKTGMLPTKPIVIEVARFFRESNVPAPVVDPVMTSSSGYPLIEEDAFSAIVEELFPVAALVTPNIPEAERLTGLFVDSEKTMREAAVAIRAMGARAVLIKGGHLGEKKRNKKPEAGEDAIDVLDNGGKVSVLRGELIPEAELHGSGCILSAAIAAGLGKGQSLEAAVREAKNFVLVAIRKAHPKS